MPGKTRNGGPLKNGAGQGRDGGWHPKFEDPVYVGPFCVWATEELEKLAADYTEEDQAKGLVGPSGQLATRLGWPIESGTRRLYRFLSGEQIWVERLNMLEWLHEADAPWWDMYDEPDFEPVGSGRNSVFRSDFGRSYNMTEDQIREAHAMHVDGLSLREIGREMWERTYYASPRTLATQLTQLFRARGLWIRSRVEATVLSNEKRGWRPYCTHVRQAGRRKGQRCDRRCIGNDLFCWHHDPERVAEQIAKLRSRDGRTLQRVA